MKNIARTTAYYVGTPVKYTLTNQSFRILTQPMYVVIKQNGSTKNFTTSLSCHGIISIFCLGKKTYLPFWYLKALLHFRSVVRLFVFHCFLDNKVQETYFVQMSHVVILVEGKYIYIYIKHSISVNVWLYPLNQQISVFSLEH